MIVCVFVYISGSVIEGDVSRLFTQIEFESNHDISMKVLSKLFSRPQGKKNKNMHIMSDLEKLESDETLVHEAEKAEKEHQLVLYVIHGFFLMIFN